MKSLAETLAIILLALALMFFLDPRGLGSNLNAFSCGISGECDK